MTDDRAAPDVSFEDHLGAVEDAVRRLEAGELALDASIDLYAEAMQSLKACHDVLERAEARLELVRRTAQGPVATDAGDTLDG